MVYSRHSVPCKSEFLRLITRFWRSEWMSYPQTFRCYSISMSWTMRNSQRTMFRTSFRQYVMGRQCLSAISTDTSTSRGIWNQSHLSSRKLSGCIVISSILHPGNVRSYEMSATEPSWRSHLSTIGKDYQSVWDFSNLQRSSTTLSSFATAIWYWSQQRSSTWPCVDWKEDSATPFWHRDRIQLRHVYFLSGRWSFMGCIHNLPGIFVHWIPMRMSVDQGSGFTSGRWTNHAMAVGTDFQKSSVEAHISLGSG